MNTFNSIMKYKLLLERIQERDTIPILLVGNKTDKEQMRQVTTEQAQQFALKIRAGHLETSVVDNQTIQLGLMEMTSMIKEHREKSIPKKISRRNSLLSPLLKRMRVRSSSLSSLFTTSPSRIPIEPILKESKIDPEKTFFLPGN